MPQWLYCHHLLFVFISFYWYVIPSQCYKNSILGIIIWLCFWSSQPLHIDISKLEDNQILLWRFCPVVLVILWIFQMWITLAVNCNNLRDLLPVNLFVAETEGAEGWEGLKLSCHLLSPVLSLCASLWVLARLYKKIWSLLVLIYCLFINKIFMAFLCNCLDGFT